MASNSKETEDSIDLPTNFAEHMARVSDLEKPPATLEEWWIAVFEQFSENDQTVELTDLYREGPTRHEVHVTDRIRYAGCAADALMAAVMEEQETVTVRSIDPIANTPVTFTVSGDSVEMSPEDALICFGSSVDRADMEDFDSFTDWVMQEDTSAVEAAICQHTHAFESQTTFEQWEANTESVTAPLPPVNLVQLMYKLSPGRD